MSRLLHRLSLKNTFAINVAFLIMRTAIMVDTAVQHRRAARKLTYPLSFFFWAEYAAVYLVTAVDRPPTAIACPSTHIGITIWYSPIWLAGIIREIYILKMNPAIRHNIPDTAKIRVPFIIVLADIIPPWRGFLPFYSMMGVSMRRDLARLCLMDENVGSLPDWNNEGYIILK